MDFKSRLDQWTESIRRFEGVCSGLGNTKTSNYKKFCKNIVYKVNIVYIVSYIKIDFYQGCSFHHIPKSIGSLNGKLAVSSK